MKKATFSTIVLLMISLTVAAQKKGDVEFGFNIGYNNFTITDENYEPSNGSGFNFGGFIDYYFSNSWSIKGKLIYDQKGWDDSPVGDLGGIAYITDYDLNYLTVPVMVNWHFGKKRNWFLEAGPYVGFLLKAEEVRNGTDITDRFSSNDFGLTLGAGIKFPLNDQWKLFFELEGQGGLNDIFKENSYTEVYNRRASINIGLNYLFK